MTNNANPFAESTPTEIRFDPKTQTAHAGELVLGRHGGANVLLGDERDDPAGAAAFAMMLGTFWRKHGVPPYIVHLGLDESYVWPPTIHRSSIRGAPFRCPACKERVKRGVTNFGVVFLCYCMAVTIPRGSRHPEPRSAREWSTIRTDAQTASVVVSAQTSGNDN
jgi:hypothetical protein